jgi:putative addiction module component (TIGR02574 family)
MTTLEEIIAAAKTLSAAERLRLVDAVWDEASPESWPRPSQAWIEEVQQRSADYDAGRITVGLWGHWDYGDRCGAMGPLWACGTIVGPLCYYGTTLGHM